MKKRYEKLFVTKFIWVVILFLSCKGMPDNVDDTLLFEEPDRWSLGFFVNSSKEWTGNIFISYNDVVPATYSNAREKNVEMGLQNLRVSKTEGITFRSRWFENSEIKEKKFTGIDFYVRTSNGNEKKFSGNNYTSFINVDYSEELIEYLSDREARVRFEIPNVYQCEFIMPRSFKNAHEFLLFMEDDTALTSSIYRKNFGKTEGISSNMGVVFDTLLKILLAGGLVAFLIWGPTLSTVQ